MFLIDNRGIATLYICWYALSVYKINSFTGLYNAYKSIKKGNHGYGIEALL